MTQVTLHAIDGTAELVVEADDNSIQVTETVPTDAGALYRTQMSVTVGNEAAQMIDCTVEEATGRISIGPDVLARLRGKPLEDPAVLQAEIAAAEQPTVQVAELAAADERVEEAAAAGAADAEAAEEAQVEAERAAAAEEEHTEPEPAAAAAEPARADAATQQDEYREQYEAWILAQQPLTMYDAANTSRSIDQMSWTGGTNRVGVDATTWTVDVALSSMGSPVEGGPYRLTIRNDGGSYYVYVDTSVADYIDALRGPAAAGAMTAAAESTDEVAASGPTVRQLDHVVVEELRTANYPVLYFAGGTAADFVEVDWDDLTSRLTGWRQVAAVGWTGPLTYHDAQTDQAIEIADAVLHSIEGEAVWIEVTAPAPVT